MIVEFTISNFRSIKEEQTFSLYAEKPGEHLLDNISYPGDGRIGVLRTAGIYGANASGKSNVLLAFEALRWLLTKNGSLEDGKSIRYYEPFRLAETNRNEPVRFEIEFVTRDGMRYIYKVGFTRHRIVEEHLSCYFSAKPALIFDRTKEDTWETIKLGSLYKGGKRQFPFFSNNTYLSKAGNSADAPELIRNVYNHFRGEVLHLGSDELLLLRNPAEAGDILNKVSSLLAHVDAGVTKVTAKENEIDDSIVRLLEDAPESVRNTILRREKWSFEFAHLTDTGAMELFDLSDESDGTQRLFHLAPIIIDALTTGGVLVLDELDNSMHPFMAELIIRLFNDPEANRGKAQLIFSTHNIGLMSSEHFRRDQIWLTEKVNGATRLYSLDDFDKKKVKPESPFNRWYLEGRFGAVPKIDYRGIVNLLKEEGGANA
jgi:AAA15 family ATPase/GTPase